MAKKPKKPSAGPRAARQRAAVAQSGPRSRGDFGLAALRDVTSPNAFTMKDEARNTGHRASLWGGDTRLRVRPVGFVSGGFIEPLKEEPRSDHSPEESNNSSMPRASPRQQPSPGVLGPKEEDVPFVPVAQALVSDLPSPPSPFPAATAVATDTGTCDSEGNQHDAVGFFIDITGDKTLAAGTSRSPPHVPDPQSSSDDSDTSSEVVLFRGRNNAKWPKERVQKHRINTAITVETVKAVTVAKSSQVDALANAAPLGDRTQRRVRESKVDIDDEEEAIIADYIANMAEDSEDVYESSSRQPFLSADLGPVGGGFDSDSPKSSMSPDVSDVSDEDEEDETVDREVLDGQALHDDDMASPTMDDEMLARLLGKQEELGMGSDELLLASGSGDGRWSAHQVDGSQKSRRGKGSRVRTGGVFSSASAVADALDDLDIVDWHRPSLQNQRKRGRRAQPPVFGLSDSEMEQTLQEAWQKDRESKKSRKIRREELRAQGLLGKHADPDDPRVRYPTGMTLEDIKAEMRSFLEGSESRLELPPMDKSARATLHELARKFKVKSQSTGSGHQRRPTLIRTKYTASYSEERLEVAMSGLGRKHFPRLDLKGKGKAAPKKSRAGAGHSAVTYQEGEVVGASAPELGQENKGRAMLEKMGWSSGMGLGSLDNKGILQPVAHVVKRTKAGLG